MIYDLNLENDQERFKKRCNAHFKNKKKVELKIVPEQRSVDQNSYVHVLFDLYAVENGYTSKESKDLVKNNCPLLEYQKNGETFRRGTSDLNKEEMSKFIEWFRDWAGQQGCDLPDATKYENNYQEFDNAINKNSQYL